MPIPIACKVPNWKGGESHVQEETNKEEGRRGRRRGTWGRRRVVELCQWVRYKWTDAYGRTIVPTDRFCANCCHH